MLKVNKKKVKEKLPLLIVTEKTREYQALLVNKQLIIPLGLCETEDVALKKALHWAKLLSARTSLMRKCLARTPQGKCLEVFRKEADTGYVPPSEPKNQ